VGASRERDDGRRHAHTGLMPLLVMTPLVTAFAAPSNSAYAATYGSEVRVDQAAYTSPLFWEQVREAIPGFDDAPELRRFRGFVRNLIVESPGNTKVLPTGQEVLTQYVFPGLQDPDVSRPAYPSLAELGWEETLQALAPLARA